MKANVPEHPRKRPGRPLGHEAALRPRPKKTDVHLNVPLPVDRRKKLSARAYARQVKRLETQLRAAWSGENIALLTGTS